MALEFPKHFGNYALKGLEEISSPHAINALPQGPGWWVLAGILLIAGGNAIHYLWKKWNANAYRRRALAALDALEGVGERPAPNWHGHLQSLPEIIRATALHAYPRGNVAALSGEEWHRFLNASTDTPLWPQSTFLALYALTYKPSVAFEVSDKEARALMQVSKAWVEKHKPKSAKKKSKRSLGDTDV